MNEEEARAAAEGADAGRRRLLRLGVYAVPLALAVDVALARRALAASPTGGETLEWPDPEEYGGPFPVP